MNSVHAGGGVVGHQPDPGCCNYRISWIALAVITVVGGSVLYGLVLARVGAFHNLTDGIRAIVLSITGVTPFIFGLIASFQSDDDAPPNMDLWLSLNNQNNNAAIAPPLNLNRERDRRSPVNVPGLLPHSVITAFEPPQVIVDSQTHDPSTGYDLNKGVEIVQLDDAVLPLVSEPHPVVSRDGGTIVKSIQQPWSERCQMYLNDLYDLESNPGNEEAVLNQITLDVLQLCAPRRQGDLLQLHRLVCSRHALSQRSLWPRIVGECYKKGTVQQLQILLSASPNFFDLLPCYFEGVAQSIRCFLEANKDLDVQPIGVQRVLQYGLRLLAWNRPDTTCDGLLHHLGSRLSGSDSVENLVIPSVNEILLELCHTVTNVLQPHANIDTLHDSIKSHIDQLCHHPAAVHEVLRRLQGNEVLGRLMAYCGDNAKKRINLWESLLSIIESILTYPGFGERELQQIFQKFVVMNKDQAAVLAQPLYEMFFTRSRLSVMPIRKLGASDEDSTRKWIEEFLLTFQNAPAWRVLLGNYLNCWEQTTQKVGRDGEWCTWISDVSLLARESQRDNRARRLVSLITDLASQRALVNYILFANDRDILQALVPRLTGEGLYMLHCLYILQYNSFWPHWNMVKSKPAALEFVRLQYLSSNPNQQVCIPSCLCETSIGSRSGKMTSRASVAFLCVGILDHSMQNPVRVNHQGVRSFQWEVTSEKSVTIDINPNQRSICEVPSGSVSDITYQARHWLQLLVTNGFPTTVSIGRGVDLGGLSKDFVTALGQGVSLLLSERSMIDAETSIPRFADTRLNDPCELAVDQLIMIDIGILYAMLYERQMFLNDNVRPTTLLSPVTHTFYDQPVTLGAIFASSFFEMVRLCAIHSNSSTDLQLAMARYLSSLNQHWKAYSTYLSESNNQEVQEELAAVIGVDTDDGEWVNEIKKAANDWIMSFIYPAVAFWQGVQAFHLDASQRSIPDLASLQQKILSTNHRSYNNEVATIFEAIQGLPITRDGVKHALRYDTRVELVYRAWIEECIDAANPEWLRLFVLGITGNQTLLRGRTLLINAKFPSANPGEETAGFWAHTCSSSLDIPHPSIIKHIAHGIDRRGIAQRIFASEVDAVNAEKETFIVLLNDWVTAPHYYNRV